MKVSVIFRTEEEQKARYEAAAKEMGVSLSAYTRIALNEKIERDEKNKRVGE